MFILQQQETTVTIKEYCTEKKVSRTTVWRLITQKKIKVRKATPNGRPRIVL